jgi:hypothetical protein
VPFALHLPSAKEPMRPSLMSSIHPRALAIAVSKASRFSGLIAGFAQGACTMPFTAAKLGPARARSAYSPTAHNRSLRPAELISSASGQLPTNPAAISREHSSRSNIARRRSARRLTRAVLILRDFEARDLS